MVTVISMAISVTIAMVVMTAPARVGCGGNACCNEGGSNDGFKWCAHGSDYRLYVNEMELDGVR